MRTHSSIHPFIYSSLILALTACGFEPMAAQSTTAYSARALPDAIASVEIQASSPSHQRMIAEQFRIDLEDLVNPGKLAGSGTEYLLSVDLNPVISPGLIAPDGKAQRFLVTMNSGYTLKRVRDGRVIENGNMQRSGSYSNLPNSYYSTYIAEQDTLKRLNRELAEQYRMKLAALLAAPPAQPSDMVKKDIPEAPLQPRQVEDLPLTHQF